MTFGAPASSAVQAQSSAQSRVSAITEQFNKKKHSKKTRNGISVEKYREVRSEPIVLPNFQSYSGKYVVDGSLLSLDLSVTADGRVTGSGTEQFENQSDIRRTFSIRDGRIEGPLLRAMKVYGNGSTQQIEGVFMKLTSFDSPSAKGVSSYGLGMVGPFYLAGNVNIDRIFFEKK
jgi:hypothetical protein